MVYRTKNSLLGKFFAWLWERTHWEIFWKLGFEHYDID